MIQKQLKNKSLEQNANESKAEDSKSSTCMNKGQFDNKKDQNDLKNKVTQQQLDKAIYEILIKLLQNEDYDEIEEILWKVKHFQDEKAKFYKNMHLEILQICNSLDNEPVIIIIINTSY